MDMLLYMKKAGMSYCAVCRGVGRYDGFTRVGQGVAEGSTGSL